MLGRHGWVAAAARRHLRSRRAAVWGVLFAATGLSLAFVPLLNVLGFEFAFVMAVVASVGAADLGAAAVRKLRDTPSAPLDRALAPGRLVAELGGRAALVPLALLLPPLLIISLNALRVKNCDWSFGLQCYLLMPALSSVGATGIGIACGFVAGERKRLSNLLPYLVVIAAVLWSLWRFYATPPVFSYNVFAGYFPGNLYDEGVELRAPFYWARLTHAAALGGVLSLVALGLDVKRARVTFGARRPEGPRRGPLAGAILGCGAALALWLGSASLGYDFDAGELGERLAGRYESEHFVIHYPPKGEAARDIELIAEDHEFRLAQVTRELGVDPPAEKITSFYFGDARSKHRLMGARRVYMAKPWRGEIYLNHAPFPHPVLRHEIVHVVASRFGDPIFGVSARRVLGLPLIFNVGLIEGIAVAADWPDHFNRALTPHQSVKALLELGMAPPVDRLLSTGFLTFSSARSYTVSGSFVRYLLDERGGSEPLRELYRSGGDFQGAYGTSRGALIAGWREMIEAVELPPGAAEVVRERFRRRSIFRRSCPHAIARLRKRAAELASRGREERAVAIAREVCSKAPGEPRYQLELAELLRKAGELERAKGVYHELAGDAEQITSAIRARALLRLVDLAARAGDWERAVELLDRAAELPVGEDLLRNILARRWVALSERPSAPALRAYFWGGDPDQPIDAAVLTGRAALALAEAPDSALAHYLVGRQLHGRGAPEEAARALERALDLGLPHELLTRECARLLAESAYRAGELEVVERAAGILQREEQPEVIRLLGADWSERVYWKQSGSLPPQ